MSRMVITLGLVAALVGSVSISYAGNAAVSKQQAATIAKSRFQGRVIAVDVGKKEKTPVYRVKVLDKKGGMHTVIIDPKTGQVIAAH